MSLEDKYRRMPLAQIRLIQPRWQELRAAVNFKEFPTDLATKYERSGFHIYLTSFAALSKAMNEEWRGMLSTPDLWSKAHLPERLAPVLDHWSRGEPLIPPSMGDLGTGGLVPLDGKHRLKAATVLCPDRIPIIMYNCDLSVINKYFNPPLLD